jgi:hypothetical protein
LLLADHPGIPHPIKLQDQHRALFPLDKPITEESGRRVAEWARGGDGAAEAPKPDPDHLQAIRSAASVDALKAAFGVAYKSAVKAGAVQAVYKSEYDTRMAALTAATPKEQEI